MINNESASDVEFRISGGQSRTDVGTDIDIFSLQSSIPAVKFAVCSVRCAVCKSLVSVLVVVAL